MVDFQSRDTTYGEPTDEEARDESPDEGERETGADEGDRHDDGRGDDTDHQGHDHHAHDRSDLGVGILTVSTTRSLDSDPSGDAIAAAVEAAGHRVVTRELVGDSRDGVEAIVNRLVARDDVDLVITTGGTGVSPDDVTVEAIRPLLEKELPGFGEVFRRLSSESIGTRVVGTRTIAGIADGVPIFALPGSEDAVTLGTEEIVLPEAGHLVGLATRGRDEEEAHR
ncbi:MAG: molybdenum cofactor biosynthesis protein B [Halanaeroarchaeum sp.]